MKNGSQVFRKMVGNYRAVPSKTRLDWLRMKVLARFSNVRSRRRPIAAEAASTPATSMFSVQPQDAIQQLNEEGVVLGLDLPSRVAEDILDFAQHTEFHLNGTQVSARVDNYTEIAREVGQEPLWGHYPRPERSCNAIESIASDPKILRIANGYLGTGPVRADIRLMWSFAGKPSRSDKIALSQFFHYDLIDYRVVKFFFYLTDVTDRNGPHVYVRGSHRARALRDKLRLNRMEIPDAHVVRHYGADRILTVLGHPGTGFATDPIGIHKGAVLQAGARLFLQVLFQQTDYGWTIYDNDAKGKEHIRHHVLSEKTYPPAGSQEDTRAVASPRQTGA